MTRNATARLVLFILIACLIVVAIGWLMWSDTGHRLRHMHQLHEAGPRVRDWVGAHQIIAPLLFLTAYVACSLLMLPVWWLQLLAGYGFGLWMGAFWNCAGATLAATVTIMLSHWLGGDWVHARAGNRIRKLQELSVAVENNGLLVVVITRLLHGVPFGLSNYLFGLMNIHPRDAAIGTFVGQLPVNTFYATLGSRPKWVKSWKFWAIVVAINLVLLTPIVIKWWKRDRNPRGLPVVIDREPSTTDEAGST